MSNSTKKYSGDSKESDSEAQILVNYRVLSLSFLLLGLAHCQMSQTSNILHLGTTAFWVLVCFINLTVYFQFPRILFQRVFGTSLVLWVLYSILVLSAGWTWDILFTPFFILVPGFLFGRLIRKESKKKHGEYLRLSRQNKTIQMDLKLAKTIQESLFPKLEPIKGIKYDLYRQIQNQIGGDFFDFVKLREGNIGIFMTDVAGHGVSSAMVAAMLKVMVATIPYTLKLDPSGLLTYLDSKMANDYKSEHATAIYLFIDFPKKVISLGNAGHPYVLYQKQREEFFEITTVGSLLGYSIQTPIAETIKFTYESGDRFFIYTDGLIEDSNPKGEYLGPEGLLQIMNQLKEEPTETFKTRLMVEITAFYKKSLFTDDTMFLICEME